MSSQIVFLVSILMSLLTWTIVAAQYIWPWLRTQGKADALRPLLLLHSIRFVGLAFLVPGVVAAELPSAFAQPAAYGDLVTAVLALLALATLRSRLGLAIAFLCNVGGTVDLLYAYYQGNATGLGAAPGLMGAMYFVPTVLVPLLLVTHVLAFLIFWRRPA